MDVKAIVTAFEHGLVFKRDDMDRLIATNRDFMWNQEMHPAKFQRIDGGQPGSALERFPWSAVDRANAVRRDAAENLRGKSRSGRLGWNDGHALGALGACKEPARLRAAALPALVKKLPEPRRWEGSAEAATPVLFDTLRQHKTESRLPECSYLSRFPGGVSPQLARH